MFWMKSQIPCPTVYCWESKEADSSRTVWSEPCWKEHGRCRDCPQAADPAQAGSWWRKDVAFPAEGDKAALPGSDSSEGPASVRCVEKRSLPGGISVCFHCNLRRWGQEVAVVCDCSRHGGLPNELTSIGLTGDSKIVGGFQKLWG